ncbi:DEAD/DEAH box helicase [bacterium]|nr:MAG: DEAD/DEAH box helicase [bacterium]
MSSPPSAFELLHPGIQRWIYREEWRELRDAQAAAIEAILPGGLDVLIAAPTAAGKTEAAFLPLLTRILATERVGVRALYIGPLKALINDQFGRLEGLCEELEIPVHRWHGDVPASAKERLRKEPSGVLLITPESLEALFIRYGSLIPRLFEGVEAVVVDEAHAFIGSERGAQLQSLLHRIEGALGRRVDRIGLSATLGEPRIAAEFLRPGGGEGVRLIESQSGSGQMRALVVGVEDPSGEDDSAPIALRQVAQHLYVRMRDSSNLVFANSRNRVEALADLLVREGNEKGVPDAFGAHHGSLSKEFRQDVEARLKEDRPFTAVCTSTLEMGIDIGAMKAIGQVGVPPSVASLRQRVGRSGRRTGEHPTIWMYALEQKVDPNSHPFDRLRVGLFQECAMLELMADRWCEPPRDTALHLSTLIQQCLSVVAERGGIDPMALYRLLCGKGPFGRVDRPTFVALLRRLHEKKLLVQSDDGTLLPGEVGERMVNHYSFYSAFATPEEYRLIHNGRPLGTLPIDFPVLPEGYLIFGGRRWRVKEIDEAARVIMVDRAATGKAPVFGNDGPFGTHPEIRQRMRRLYEDDRMPAYLDQNAKRLFSEGREEYARLRLDRDRTMQEGDGTLLFLWGGDYAAATLAMLLRSESGFDSDGDGFALEIPRALPGSVVKALRNLAAQETWPSPLELAKSVPIKAAEKHDAFLSEELLAQDYASRIVDIEGARRVIESLV